MTKIVGLKEFIREAEMHRSQEHWQRLNERRKLLRKLKEKKLKRNVKKRVMMYDDLYKLDN